MKTETYKVGIYARQSRDDNEENVETIENQRDLLIDFVKKNKLGEILSIYMDDNISGSGFRRKGIERLKKDIISGKVNLLVMKDLSRLGRNNAKTLLFLDFLEEYNVRVITCDGRYDSDKDSDMVGIETWFNERYIKDISRKIRASLKFKIDKGEYIGNAPYGYIKSDTEKNKLCIDNDTAYVVREIYKMYRKGYGYKYIAGFLNSGSCPPPSKRCCVANPKLQFDSEQEGNAIMAKWSPEAVRRILTNSVYIGDTVQGVSEKVSFKSKKTKRLPKSRWVVTAGTHEPIISREEFEAVQRIREEKKVFSGTHKNRFHIFRGMLYCGGCGSAMHARIRKDRPLGYICGNYGKNGRSACTSHHLAERVISDVFTNEILKLFENQCLFEKAIDMAKACFQDKRNENTSIVSLKKQLLNRQRQQDILYMDRLEGKVSEQMFLRINAGVEEKIIRIKQQIEEINNTKKSVVNIDDILAKFLEDLRNKGVTRRMIGILAERVTVYDVNDIVPDKAVQDKRTCDNKLMGKGIIVIDFKTDKV